MKTRICPTYFSCFNELGEVMISHTIDTFLHKNPVDIFISHKSKYTNLKAKISELCRDYLYYGTIPTKVVLGLGLQFSDFGFFV